MANLLASTRYCTRQRTLLHKDIIGRLPICSGVFNSHNLDIHQRHLHQSTRTQTTSKGDTSSASKSGIPTVGEKRLPDFRDTKFIYKSKTFKELFKSHFVFTLCSFDFLVNNQTKILGWTRKILGRSLFRKVMKWTIYGQFMAGETAKEVISVARRGADAGLYTMLAYTAAEIHGDAKDSADMFQRQADMFKTNKQAMYGSLDMAVSCKEFSCMVPLVPSKMTFFTHSKTLFKLNEVLEHQSQLITAILTNNGHPRREEFLEFLRDVLAETAVKFDGAVLPSRTDIHVASLTTSLPFNLILNKHHEKLNNFLQKGFKPVTRLTQEEENNVIEVWQTINDMAQYAEEKEVVLIWDAEQTYLQVAIDCLVLESMRKYNRHRPVVHNTIQCYLKGAYDKVTRDLELGKIQNFCLGFKVVRGAYIDEERRRSSEMGYEDPVNPTYDATTHMYEKVADHLLDTLKQSTQGKLYVTFATHNEDTVKHVVAKAIEKDIPLDTTNNIGFAQLYGMRDHISLALCQAGIPTGTVVHYGDVEEAMMWLSRRLSENRSGQAAAVVERNNTRKEMMRRLFNK